jgi:SSS family solute:Na+ symporter
MAALLAFLSLNLAIALFTWWRCRQDTQPGNDDYYLARRTLGAPMVAASLLLTNLSTEQLVGLNGASYRHGATVIAWEVFGAFGLLIFALVFLPRYWASGVTTIPEYVGRRCGAPTRHLMVGLMLASLVGIAIPSVLYSGALALAGIFDLPHRLGFTPATTVFATALGLGLAAAGYALKGGLRGVAVSDAVYGALFVVGALLIPILGLAALGHGDVAQGWTHLVATRREAFDPFGPAGSPLPADALLTGMIVINLSAWCANQNHAQRAFAACNLAEAQKGVLLAAGLKLLGPVILVLPGLIAGAFFADGLMEGDLAYPRLVQAVLPAGLAGLFGVAVFGAIVTSLSGAIHSATTLFVVDVLRRPSSGRLPLAGRVFGIAVCAAAVLLTPLIARQDSGFFMLMRRLNALFTIPVVAVVTAAVLTRWRWQGWAPPFAMAGGSAVYFLLGGWHAPDAAEMHWLHSVALAATLAFLLLGLLRNHTVSEPPAIAATPPHHYPHLRLSAVGLSIAGLGLYLTLALLARAAT